MCWMAFKNGKNEYFFIFKGHPTHISACSSHQNMQACRNVCWMAFKNAKNTHLCTGNTGFPLVNIKLVV